MKGEPDPNSNSGEHAGDNELMTKAKFDSLTYTEQKEWKDKNLEEYHKLINN